MWPLEAPGLRLSFPLQEPVSALSQGPSHPGHFYHTTSPTLGPRLSLAVPVFSAPPFQLSDLPSRPLFPLAALSLHPFPHMPVTTHKLQNGSTKKAEIY